MYNSIHFGGKKEKRQPDKRTGVWNPSILGYASILPPICENSEFQGILECPKGSAKYASATLALAWLTCPGGRCPGKPHNARGFLEKNSKLSVGTVAKPTKLEIVLHDLSASPGTGNLEETFYNRFLLEIPMNDGGKREVNEAK
jgi:hypothetical protein